MAGNYNIPWNKSSNTCARAFGEVKNTWVVCIKGTAGQRDENAYDQSSLARAPAAPVPSQLSASEGEGWESLKPIQNISVCLHGMPDRKPCCSYLEHLTNGYKSSNKENTRPRYF